MTEIAKELLEDVQPGDYVQVRYGTNVEQTEYTGIVLKWSENFLSLRDESGEVAKVRLDDNLRTLKKLQQGSTIRDEDQHLFGNEDNSSGTLMLHAPIMRQMVALPDSRSYNFSDDTCLEKARTKLKSLDNSNFKKTLAGILDSLSYAVKNHNVEGKYHNLRARLMLAQQACQSYDDYETFFYLLGILALLAFDYEYSLESLVRAHEYSLAAYAAELGGLTASSQILTLCALLSKDSTDVDQRIANIIVARKDVDTLNYLVEEYQYDLDISEKIATCAVMLFQASNSTLDSAITSYHSAYSAAKQLISVIPSKWQQERSALSWWKEFCRFSYSNQLDKPITNEEYSGYITYFDNEKKFGFINPDHYFYISQVISLSEKGLLLRKVLFLGLWHHLEVTFRLGKSPTRVGEKAATSIELTDKGYEEAIKRINDSNQETIQQFGFVEDFFSRNMSGRIQSKGQVFRFKISSIVDPWLKAYYEQCFAPREQDVSFELVGKNVQNICWVDPDENDRNRFADAIKPADMNRWEHYLSTRNEKADMQIPDDDPYSNYEYRDLQEIVVNGETAFDAPLIWGGKSPMEHSGKDTQSVLNSPTVVSFNTNTEERTVAHRSSIQGKTYAERARKAVLQGRFEEAERAFEQSLQTEGFNEAVVCDYISLNLRQEGNIDKAIVLLQKYEKKFSREKLMNLKIQVYDKKKDYTVLCELYEAAYRTSSSASKKSHFLFRLIDAYVKLGKYTEALSACTRWEQFYSQNRYGAEADKLKNAEPNIRRQKALCLYYLDKIDEAQKIATDLVRSNPADALANSILNRTLGSSDSKDAVDGIIDDSMEFDIDNSNEEVSFETDSQMSRFVRLLIQQTDIAIALKTPNIKDGRYVGSSKAALDDVRKLASGRRISAKTRSDSLLAASKLLEQIEQRDDGSIQNLYYKYRLTGRAMSSWGDYMVAQANQLDTTRMAYLYSLRVLVPTKKGTEQDWVNSYNRYLKSFFLARVGTNSLDEYITLQANSREKDGPNTDIFVGSHIQEVLLSEFLVGILMFIQAIHNQNEHVDLFIDELYSKNTDLRKSICHQLEVISGRTISDYVKKEDFKRILFQSIEELEEKKNQLHSFVTDISNIVLSQSLREEDFDKLNSINWQYYITATDFTRYNRFYYILKRSQDFFGSRDFENRSDCLRAVLVEVNDLRQSIHKEPTDVSFDIFLPALEQIALRVNEKQTDLYQDFLPKLNWHETIQPFRTPDGRIQIQLTVENEVNYQSADSLKIVAVFGPEIKGFDSVLPIQTLRGGDEAEQGIIVSISDSANASGSFTATVAYSYKCSDAPQTIITKTQEIDFTFIVRDEFFEPLINPYYPYVGNIMDNDAMFVGRSAQIQQILKMICPTPNSAKVYGRAIAMYGQTRTGKSSLIFHLKKQLQEQYPDDVLIWDIENIGNIEENEAYMVSFLYTLLNVGNASFYDNPSVLEIVKKAGLTPPLDEIRRDPTFAVTLFNEYMRKLDRILKQEKKIIVLFVDEFTYLHGLIKSGKLSEGFMRFWKALLQNYCIFAIVAGQDDMPEFMREHPNEFACMELIKLNYLAEGDAKRLIQEPLETANHRTGLFRNDGSIHQLYTLTAGSAYLTIILCSNLVEYLNEKGAYMVTKGIVDDFLRTRAFGPNSFLNAEYFEAQLQERGHEELNGINFSLLLSIARLSQMTGYADIHDIECDEIRKEEIQMYVDRLVDRNVLVKEGRDRYGIQVKLLQRWLISTEGV